MTKTRMVSFKTRTELQRRPYGVSGTENDLIILSQITSIAED